MKKFTPQFQIWALGPLAHLIICACTTTKEVLVLTWTPDTGLQEMEPKCRFPDLRVLHPMKWDEYPGAKRAGIRDVFQVYLEGRHGAEVMQHPAICAGSVE